MDAQEADKARRAAAENPSDARKQEIQGIMRRAIHAHRQLDFETAEKLLVQASERYPPRRGRVAESGDLLPQPR